MRSRFGHPGDIIEGIREIYDSLPEDSNQRGKVKELALKVTDYEGSWENLEGFWPELMAEYNHYETLEPDTTPHPYTISEEATA